MRGATVADAMTGDVISVRPETPLREVADLLARHGVRAVPVVTPKGTLVGVVPEGRVSVAELDAELDAEETELVPAARHRRTWWQAPRGPVAGDRMSIPATTIEPGASLVDATRRLSARGVARLWVVDEVGRLVGVLTRRDLLRSSLRPDEAVRADVADEVLGRILGARPGTVTVTVSEGVVTLTGRLQWRSDVELAVWLTRALPGVVDVVNQLGCLYVDPPAARRETRALRDRLR
ncbi:CBS domain-containing protein [Streptoalloteichus hindustanus]|uniref:CBS domain-containing protein n=1 Tax=Streptoalloteichus hindustanus TaxID=2017 RepID=A0A1M5N6C3_STRHI|nr:CBS domain-containing protein [Streptoalloteichus hindustanus]SHG85136.1 CBS domain-containing protein [Streptoalloteichus hindustanus]